MNMSNLLTVIPNCSYINKKKHKKPHTPFGVDEVI
jgi:hypothetical protein